jgi:hypothetical protein
MITNPSTAGKAYIFDTSDNCVGMLFQNLTTLTEKETTKNAADDTLKIENYISKLDADYDMEVSLLQNEYSIFIPNGDDFVTGNMVGRLYVIKNTYINQDGSNDVIGAECKSALIELLDEPVTWLTINNTPSNALDQLFNHAIQSRFGVGYVDGTGLANAFGTVQIGVANGPTKTNKLDYLVSMVKIYGGEISCSANYDPTSGKLSRKVNWYVQRGFSRGKLLMLEKDMAEVNISINTDNILTRIYGYGKYDETTLQSVTFASINGGLTYTDVAAGNPRFNWCPKNADGSARSKSYVLYDDSVEDPVALFDQATTILAKCGDPAISITAKINTLQNYLMDIIEGTLTLTFGDFTPEPWFIGDTVHIYTDELYKWANAQKISFMESDCIKSRIVEYERDHINPEKTSVTINSTCVGITDEISKIAKDTSKKGYIAIQDGANTIKLALDYVPPATSN